MSPDDRDILHALRDLAQSLLGLRQEMQGVRLDLQNLAIKSDQTERKLFEKLKIMAATLDQVLQDVTDESTLGDSIITLLTGIKAQLDAVLAGALPPATQAKVDAIFDGLEANKAKLAAAITANTPAEPPPAP